MDNSEEIDENEQLDTNEQTGDEIAEESVGSKKTTWANSWVNLSPLLNDMYNYITPLTLVILFIDSCEDDSLSKHLRRITKKLIKLGGYINTGYNNEFVSYLSDRFHYYSENLMQHLLLYERRLLKKYTRKLWLKKTKHY